MGRYTFQQRPIIQANPSAYLCMLPACPDIPLLTWYSRAVSSPYFLHQHTWSVAFLRLARLLPRAGGHEVWDCIVWLIFIFICSATSSTSTCASGVVHNSTAWLKVWIIMDNNCFYASGSLEHWHRSENSNVATKWCWIYIPCSVIYLRVCIPSSQHSDPPTIPPNITHSVMVFTP